MLRRKVDAELAPVMLMKAVLSIPAPRDARVTTSGALYLSLTAPKTQFSLIPSSSSRITARQGYGLRRPSPGRTSVKAVMQRHAFQFSNETGSSGTAEAPRWARGPGASHHGPDVAFEVPCSWRITDAHPSKGFPEAARPGTGSHGISLVGMGNGRLAGRHVVAPSWSLLCSGLDCS